MMIAFLILLGVIAHLAIGWVCVYITSAYIERYSNEFDLFKIFCMIAWEAVVPAIIFTLIIVNVATWLWYFPSKMYNHAIELGTETKRKRRERKSINDE